MGEADSVIGKLQIGVQVHLAAAPDGAIAVFVAGEIVEVCHQHLAVLIGRIDAADKVGAGDTEGVVGPGAAVEQQAIEIGVGNVAAELTQPGPSGPGIGTDFRAFERPYRMRRKGHPEASGIRTRSHIIPVDVIRIGDPECRSSVVRGKQDMLGLLAILILDRQKKACRLTRQCWMTLGLDSQVFDDLITRLYTVLHEKAVPHSVVGDIVFNAQVIRAMNGHAAAVGVVNRGVLNVLSRHVAVEMPVNRVAGELQVLAHAS